MDLILFLKNRVDRVWKGKIGVLIQFRVNQVWTGVVGVLIQLMCGLIGLSHKVCGMNYFHNFQQIEMEFGTCDQHQLWMWGVFFMWLISYCTELCALGQVCIRYIEIHIVGWNHNSIWNSNMGFVFFYIYFYSHI